MQNASAERKRSDRTPMSKTMRKGEYGEGIKEGKRADPYVTAFNTGVLAIRNQEAFPYTSTE